MPEIAENADEKLSNHMRRLLNFLLREWKGSQSQIESLNNDLEQTPIVALERDEDKIRRWK